jgi:hypothetical protein
LILDGDECFAALWNIERRVSGVECLGEAVSVSEGSRKQGKHYDGQNTEGEEHRGAKLHDIWSAKDAKVWDAIWMKKGTKGLPYEVERGEGGACRAVAHFTAKKKSKEGIPCRTTSRARIESNNRNRVSY